MSGGATSNRAAKRTIGVGWPREVRPGEELMPVLATCPVCGRQVVVHNGHLREHLPPRRFAERKCPGSGGKVAA